MARVRPVDAGSRSPEGVAYANRYLPETVLCLGWTHASDVRVRNPVADFAGRWLVHGLRRLVSTLGWPDAAALRVRNSSTSSSSQMWPSRRGAGRPVPLVFPRNTDRETRRNPSRMRVAPPAGR